MEKVLHLVVRQSPRVPPTSGSHRTNCIYYHSAFFHPRAQYQRGLVWWVIFWVKNVRKKLSISDTFSSNTNTDTEKVCVLQIQRQRQRKDADKYKIAFWPNARHTSHFAPGCGSQTLAHGGIATTIIIITTKLIVITNYFCHHVHHPTPHIYHQDTLAIFSWSSLTQVLFFQASAKSTFAEKKTLLLLLCSALIITISREKNIKILNCPV